jgi:hypothetical protein
MSIPAPARSSPAADGPARVPLAGFALTAVALAILFASAHAVVGDQVLATWRGETALAPWYAFVQPVARPGALLFVLLAAAITGLAPRGADPERTTRSRFGVLLAAAAILLPFALFLARSGAAALGTQFDVYRNEEFLHDARRIADLPRFLEQYVELMPTLSLHGQHFPPGHAVLLYGAGKLLGPSPFAAGMVVLLFGAAAVVLAWRTIAELASERAARQGALLLLAAPSLLVFTCTSMDAVFLFFATLAWHLSIRALAEGARPRRAWLAGAAILSAAVFSFSALPVGLAILVFAVLRGRAAPARTAGILLQILAGTAVAALALHLATGFPIWTCFLRARESNAELMRHAAGAGAGTLWGLYSLGNASAFLSAAGIGLVAAFAAGWRRRRHAREPVAAATVLALLVMAGGGIYFLETERIWLFALPWLAASAVAAGAFDERSLRRALALGFLQALVVETTLFTLW